MIEQASATVGDEPALPSEAAAVANWLEISEAYLGPLTPKEKP